MPLHHPHHLPGLAALLALWLAATSAWAQALPEVELKAQILWRALQFVEWPAEVAPAQPLQLCLLAPGPLAEVLREWPPRELNGHRVELRRVPGAGGGAGGTAPSAAAAAGCHIAYVGADAQLPAPPPRALLWVGDSHGATERGVMFNLQPQQGRIVFDVDLHAARRAGLEINARLLRLARFVHMEGPP
jgi:hypothetical protein